MREKIIGIVVCLFLFSSFFIIGSGSSPIDSCGAGVKKSQKSHLSFAAFTDTHIGARYQQPLYDTADHLDQLSKDLVNATNRLDFVIHLGDLVNHNTAQVNGEGLPWYVDQYRNNLKAYLIDQVNLPLYCIMGNHDGTDYQMNKDDPHNLTKSLVDELSLNALVYAMMYNGILFLVVPELGCVTWTHPVEYTWITYMTCQYPTTTTVILCHQAIEDTTREADLKAYRGKQDMDWWATLFQNNPQIKLWIHGHNHIVDWYVSNQSTGLTNPIYGFGHEIAFSSPYPEMDWAHQYETDRLVIYNISSTSISTAGWEDNGARGHWISECLHTWNVSTTFNPDAENWYSFPVFLQDNETQLTDMKLLSPDITLQLAGTAPMELFFDSKMESPNGSANENILGFGNDTLDKVIWMNPGMQVHGPTTLTFPSKYPDSCAIQEDGRSGQPYQSFPMGTIAAAVPGQTYDFTMTARCIYGEGRVDLNVNCCDWGKRSQYSILSGSDHQVFSHVFGSVYETIHGVYTVPDDQNAWFLQGTIDFPDFLLYDVSLFSVKRQQTSNTTEDFHLLLSGHWFNNTGALAENEHEEFSISPENLCDSEGVMNFTAFIQGNHYGMVNLIYHEPLLMGMNARFRINSYDENTYNLSLTKIVSRNSAFKTMIWDSTLFQKIPRATELLVRFLMKGAIGNIFMRILERLYPEPCTTFKMIPFSTSSLYDSILFTTNDGSALKHLSRNGNLWFSCDCPIKGESYLQITLPTR
jgi:hypothetical protein